MNTPSPRSLEVRRLVDELVAIHDVTVPDVLNARRGYRPSRTEGNRFQGIDTAKVPARQPRFRFE